VCRPAEGTGRGYRGDRGGPPDGPRHLQQRNHRERDHQWRRPGGRRLLGTRSVHRGAFSAIEDNSIFGNLTVTGYTACWFGAFRNYVPGTMRLSFNVPHAQFGDSGGGLNIVGFAGGECVPLSVPGF
jgi:hypothetical protein